jgi:hypothetical protein
MKKIYLLLGIALGTGPALHAQWQLTGNAISPGNFIGTTNFQNLLLKANNYSAGLIDVSNQNTFLGEENGGSSTSAVQGVAMGRYALSGNSTGQGNVAFGRYALAFNTTGAFNTAVGLEAMYGGQVSNNNVAVGPLALYHVNNGGYTNQGIYNCAMGSNALQTLTDGNWNDAFGGRALYTNSLGYANEALGHGALYLSTTSTNIALGFDAMDSNAGGADDIIVGCEAGWNSHGGTDNIGYGFNAMRASASNFNIGIGDEALYYAGGPTNTAIGASALLHNSGASTFYNIAIGDIAMYQNTTGGSCTTLGLEALVNNTSGLNDIAFGAFSLAANTTGNLAVSVGTGANATSSGFTEGVSLGYDASCMASYEVVVGNTSMVSIGGYVNWTNFSDGRYKKNIKENVPGLAFVRQLRPVTYNLDLTSLQRVLTSTTEQAAVSSGPAPPSRLLPATVPEPAPVAQKEKIRYTGFVAQEVDTAARSLSYSFDGVAHLGTTPNLYGLNYGEFLVPVTASVQELSRIHDSLAQVLSDLQDELYNAHLQLNRLAQMAAIGSKEPRSEARPADSAMLTDREKKNRNQ